MAAPFIRTCVLSAAVALLAAACSGAPGSTETTGSEPSNLAFSQGNDLGYCASNPSPECAQGTPVKPKQLILTFDDGPGSQTAAFSSWLRSQGIRATFFVLGEYVGSSNNPVLAQLQSDGHLVGNHTYDHQDLTTLSSSQVVNEVSSTDALIAPFVAGSHFVFRAPYGAWSSQDYNALQNSPMKKYAGPVRWDIGGQMTSTYAADWDCWQNQSGYGVMTSKQCGDRYLKQIADVGRGIVLMHDQDYGDVSNHNLTSGQGNTIDMVKYMVPILKQQGYSFLRVDEVPDVAAALGATPPPPTDGGTDSGGTCAFNPTWSQGNANEWWVEYAISGNIASAFLEVPGSQNVTLSPNWGKWVGGPNAQIPSGTTVIVHATNGSNQTAQTKPFPYLVTTNPVTACGGASDGGAPDAGPSDGGGGSDGGTSCALDPTWAQGSGANNWWVEYAITASATIASASLEVVGGQTVSLSFQWGKWVGLANASIPTGASVVVHAQDTSGNLAQTSPFGYLVTTTPTTAGCP